MQNVIFIICTDKMVIQELSQKILLESELFVTQNVDMDVADSCLEYGVLSRLDLMLWEFVYNNMSVRGHENLNFDPFSFGGGVHVRTVREAACLLGQLYQKLLMFSEYTKAS